MLFNSLTFIVFFTGVVILHHLPLSWRTKKLNLVIASYIFYAAWNPPFVVLLWISTGVAWLAAQQIGASSSRARKRLFLSLSLFVDLGMLGYFKYADFVLENFARLLQGWGVSYAPPRLDIVLPIGISFYTFHTMSYIIDVYRGQFAPWRSFLDFSLYVSFFPQLVAGPIVRARQFLPQCLEPRRVTTAEFVWGLNLLIIGLFLKIVLADRLFRPVVDTAYNPAIHPDVIGAWGSTMAFCGQIYCDFAGYSTCAIGGAMCLGFALPDNFRWPVASIGFVDFWQRWHISLSTWLRDYVYVSLGGNRQHPVRSAGNTMLTMLLAGLWHGASWTFITFGALQGAGLVAENMLRSTPAARRSIWQHPVVRFTLAGVTLVLLGITCIFFRAQTMGQAAGITATMFGWRSEMETSSVPEHQLWLAIVPLEILFITHFLLRETTLEQVVAKMPSWVWGTLLTGMLTSILLMPGDERAFVYFQF